MRLRKKEDEREKGCHLCVKRSLSVSFYFCYAYHNYILTRISNIESIMYNIYYITQRQRGFLKKDTQDECSHFLLFLPFHEFSLLVFFLNATYKMHPLLSSSSSLPFNNTNKTILLLNFYYSIIK